MVSRKSYSWSNIDWWSIETKERQFFIDEIFLYLPGLKNNNFLENEPENNSLTTIPLDSIVKPERKKIKHMKHSLSGYSFLIGLIK